MASLLLTEDNGELANVYTASLQGMGHVVTAVKDVPSAKKQLSSGARFDVFIVDFWLNGQPALDLLVDTQEALPDLPIVVISGGDGSASAEVSRSLAEMSGTVHFLFKPFSMRDLDAKIAQILSSRG